MNVDLLSGIALIAVGAFASGSFSMPFEKVEGWKWENHWLIYSLFAYVVVPLLSCLVFCPDFLSVLSVCPPGLLGRIFLLGVLYGICNLTFGLSLKYLGVSLGFIISLGLMMVLGTVIPPVLDGRIAGMFGGAGGVMLVWGLSIGIIGVLVSAYAGYKKDTQSGNGQEPTLNFRKGILLALFVGLTGASQALGIEQGNGISRILLERGVDELFVMLPTVTVLFAGSFLITLIWCVWVGYKNGSLKLFAGTGAGKLIPNYLFCALSGFLWFLNMITYGMGKSFMGEYSFTAWGILMSLTIVFATIWGLYRGEWKQVAPRVRVWMYIGLSILVTSSFIIGMSSN